ncbi:putative enoyl-CoA hydratase 1 [bacterium BMS3Abin02]|nr:putative enoyl-CoA hydratase 1 [bacterium BMS3Abin02]GBE21856.1 putative enoyl-CoA hydratase 1 [bacterium BMS3Bbin01]HDH25587.1 MaoC family dehydratase [Actinomycetota bacterium]
MQHVVPVDRLDDYIGRDLGVSDWMTVDQARVDAFADTTLDHQFIHVDPERAKATPWGTTIAQGFLTLSLVPYLLSSTGIVPEGTVMAINYGTDKVRFLEAVKVPSEIRARASLADVTKKGPGRYVLKVDATVEIKGVEKPALVAEMLAMFVVAE